MADAETHAIRASMNGLQTKLKFQKVEAPSSEPCRPDLQTFSTVRHILDRQLVPHESPFLHAAAAAEASRAYALVHSFRYDHWRPGRFAQACFSGSGDLLALLIPGLGVRIIDYRAFQSRPLRSDSIFEDAYWTFPEAHIPTCYAAARCPAWNPQREPELYLLARKAVLRCSVQRFEDLEDFEEAFEAFDQADAEHIAFFRSNPHLFAVSTSKGKVSIWDPRANCLRQQTSLVAPQNMTQLAQVQASSDGHVVTAGTRSGQIIMWDIRKSRSGVHQLGAYGPAMQPVLAVISMRKALAAIPGLSAETHIPKPSLFQLLMDPLDDTRAGYTLGCGWQGCIDLQRQEITHAYCPPARIISDDFLHPAMWQPGSPFVSLQLNYCGEYLEESGAFASLEFLDFSSGSASPCMVRGDCVQRSLLPSATTLALEGVEGIAAAMHPTTHDVVVPSCTAHELHIVSQRPNVSESATKCDL